MEKAPEIVQLVSPVSLMKEAYGRFRWRPGAVAGPWRCSATPLSMEINYDGFKLEVEGGRADGVGCVVCVSPVGPVHGGGDAFSLDGRLASESEEAEFCFRRQGRGRSPRSLGGPAFLPASYPLDNKQPPLPGPDGNADGNRE